MDQPNNVCSRSFLWFGGNADGIGTAFHAIAVLPVILHFRFPTSSTSPICLNSNTRGRDRVYRPVMKHVCDLGVRRVLLTPERV
jgi:hypothetical protein